MTTMGMTRSPAATVAHAASLVLQSAVGLGAEPEMKTAGHRPAAMAGPDQ
jgi:hypothetical protein